MVNGRRGNYNLDRNMNGAKASDSGFTVFAIVRDKYGRIVVDEEVFRDPVKLEKLRQEVLKNGRNSSDGNP